MKDLRLYIKEAEDSEDDKKIAERSAIKFTIWKEPKKQVYWLNDNESYQKIEYKYINKDDHIEIDFLLGYDTNNESWNLWIGKIGSLTYDDDPHCDLKTKKFAEAINISLDKIQEFIQKVKDDKQNWVQFYKNM